MSVINLSFGQCGIQIAQNLFTTLYEDINTKSSNSSHLNKEYTNEATKRWFSVNKRGLWLPRSILIDCDNKTIPAENKCFKFNNVLVKPVGGCGNNWASGFCDKSLLFVGEVEEKLRKIFESDGEVRNILSLLSVAGGTGSGVGTRVLQHIREYFPEKCFINVLVLPCNSGEVAVQSYNTLFAFSKLYDVSDALFLFENDKLQSYYKANVGFTHLNSFISKQLAVALQPVADLQLQDLISKFSVRHKLIQLRGGSFAREQYKSYETAATWSVLMKEIVKVKKLKSTTNIVITRGIEKPEVDSTILQHYHQNRSFKNENRNLVLLSNNNSISGVINVVIEDSWKLFTHGAYLHHYLKYGIDEQYFLSAFQRLETILYDYKNL